MNATMIKGERSKLLAVAVVIAMVACALVAFMPSSNADAPEADTEVNSLPELQTALTNPDYDVIEVGSAITLDETVQLDLNNKTIIVPYNHIGSIYLNGGSLSNGTVYGNAGNIVNVVSGSIASIKFQDFNIAINNNINSLGELNITGCYFNAKDDGTSCNAIYLNLDTDTADVTIKGCEFTGTYIENNLNLAMYDGFDQTKVTVIDSDLSINVYGPQVVDSETQLVIGTNLDIDDLSVISNINMTQVGASTGNPQGTAPTISVPNDETLSVGSITGSGSVSANPESVECDSIEIPIIDSGTGNTIVSTYEALVAAINSDADMIVLTDNIGEEGDLVEGDIALGSKTLDLNGNQLSLGTFGITLDAGTITNGTITKTGGSSSNGIAVNVSGNSTIDGVKFVMTASEEGYMPFALSFSSGESIITKCSFTANGERFAVMQENFGTAGGTVTIKDSSFDNGIVVIKEYGKVDIQNSGDVIISVGLYGGDTGITVPMNKDTFTYSGTTNITETVIGWDPCTLGPDATYQGDITLAVDGNYDLGMITTGAVEIDHQTNVLNIRSGNVTATGGDGIYLLTIGENGTFTAGESGFSVYQISAQNPDQIIGNIYVGDGGVQLPSTSGKPTADNFYVAFNTKQCYNGDSQIPDISVYGPSNIVGQVTILTDMEQFALTNVSDGSKDVRITVSFSYTINGVVQGDDGQGVGTQVTLRFSWSLAPAEPTLEITVPEWNYGDEDKSATAEAIGVDGLPLDGGTYDYVYMQNGVEVDPDKLEVGSATVYVTYTPEESNTNYTTVTDSKNFTVGNAKLDISVDTPNQNGWFDENNEEYGQVSDYVGNDFSVVEIDATSENPNPEFDYELKGTVIYVHDCPIYGEGMNNGYYIVLNIINDENFDVPYQVFVNDNGRTTGNTIDVGSELIWIYVEDLSDSISIKFTADGFDELEYKFDVSELYRNTTAGYAADQQAAINGMIAAGIGSDATTSTVSPETMWIAFDPRGETAPIGYAYYGNYVENGKLVTPDEDALINTETLSDSGRWFFAFAGETSVKDDIEVDPLPGVYTIVIERADGTVLTYDTVAIVDAVVKDAGFDMLPDDILAAITAAGGSVNGDGTEDISPNTMWMVWDSYGYSNGYTANGSVIFDGKKIWGQDGMSCSDKTHTWYFSFGTNPSLGNIGVDIQMGTYTLKIEIVDAEGEVVKTITEDVTVDAQDSKVSFLDPADLSDLGITAMDIQTTVDFSEFTIAGDDATRTATVDVNAHLFYFTNFTGFWGDDASKYPGYYVAFNINDTGFDWTDAKVVITGTQTKECYEGSQWGIFGGTLVLYLGTNADDPTTYTISVDYDNEGTFYRNVTYTLNFTVEPAEVVYNLILSEEESGVEADYVYPDGILSVITGERFYTIHNGPNGNYSTAYWMPSTYTDGTWAPITDENKRISADTLIDLAYYDALDGVVDYTVKLYVVYEEKGATGGSAATSYDIDAVINDDGTISISAVNNNGEQNASAYFVYKIVFRSSTPGSEGFPVDKIEYTGYSGSGLVNGGPCEDSVTITPDIDIQDGWNVDVTLITLNGTIEVFYGTTTTTA